MASNSPNGVFYPVEKDAIMTTETDFTANDAAEEIANQAFTWFMANRSIQAMIDSLDITIRFESPLEDCRYHTQPLNELDIRYGHIIKNQGVKRCSRAAAKRLSPNQPLLEEIHYNSKEHWILCSVSEHPPNNTDDLTIGLTHSILVHEAIHILDGKQGYITHGGFQNEHMGNLQEKYYSTPHEFNAYYHQGLYAFRRNLPRIKVILSRYNNQNSPKIQKKNQLRRMLYDGIYWEGHFLMGMNNKYRRKFIRRYMKLCMHLNLL
jgi:hypothetical protein